jgi:hypothetical protein
MITAIFRTRNVPMAADHSGPIRVWEEKSDTPDRINRRRDNRRSAGLDFTDQLWRAKKAESQANE